MARHATSPVAAVDIIDTHRMRIDALGLLAWYDYLTAPGYQPLPAELDAWTAKAAMILQEIAR